MPWVSRTHLLVDTHRESKQILACYLPMYMTSTLWQTCCPLNISARCRPCFYRICRADLTQNRAGCYIGHCQLLRRSRWLTRPLTLLPSSLQEACFVTVCDKVRIPPPIMSLCNALLPVLLEPNTLQSFHWKNTPFLLTVLSLPRSETCNHDTRQRTE